MKIFIRPATVVLLLHLWLYMPAQNLNAGADFPKLVFADINGAPRLTQPVPIMGASGPLRAQGMGWASPAVWDWNNDGKKDILIGEFGSGIETSRHIGNLIRVFKNIGTDAAPAFEGDFQYAHPVDDGDVQLSWKDDPDKYPAQLTYYGSPLSIPQFCCMSFKPQFADINNDGFADLYAGRYSPGEVYWFRGSEFGFLPGERLKQHGNAGTYKKNNGDYADPQDWSYWSYSAVSFGDFTGDGLKDMIVGGFGGLRISVNIGTADSPEFGKRELLLDTEGSPLSDEQKRKALVPYVVDWDQDGLLDLLVTSSYTQKGKAILFYKGVNKHGEYRFEKGVSLFDAKEDAKAFPGEYLNVFVSDWNNDGVNDLLVGTKLAFIDSRFDSTLNWSWANDMGAVAKINPGYYSESRKKEIEERISQAGDRKEQIRKNYYGGNERYKTLIHQGYVYILFGRN